MADIFLSYSQKDSHIASELRERLQQFGLKVDSDSTELGEDSTELGEKYVDKVRAKLESARALVILLSSHSAKDRWVGVEFREALRSNRRIYPVFLDPDAKNNVIWPLLADRAPLEMSWDRVGEVSQIIGRSLVMEKRSYNSRFIALISIAISIIAFVGVVSLYRALELRSRIKVLDRSLELLHSVAEEDRVAGVVALRDLGLGRPELAQRCADGIVMFIQSNAPLDSNPMDKLGHIREGRFVLAPEHLQPDITQDTSVALESLRMMSRAFRGQREWVTMRLRFSETRLAGANFDDGELVGANFDRACLWKSKWANARLIGCRMRECDLRGADLRFADLSGCDFTGATLVDADLSGANLTDAIFDEADLSSANLSATYAQGATFRRANLSGASLLRMEHVTEKSIIDAIITEQTVPPTETLPEWWPTGVKNLEIVAWDIEPMIRCESIELSSEMPFANIVIRCSTSRMSRRSDGVPDYRASDVRSLRTSGATWQDETFRLTGASGTADIYIGGLLVLGLGLDNSMKIIDEVFPVDFPTEVETFDRQLVLETRWTEHYARVKLDVVLKVTPVYR